MQPVTNLSNTSSQPPSTPPPDNKLSLKSFGPGILMASAAIGGSHLIASTQAGALYGWQLAIMIILANLFKYPFFRFGTEYAYRTGNSLIVGYAQKSRSYLWIFFILSIFSGIVSTGAVALLCAIILGHLIPFELSGLVLSVLVMAISWVMLIAGHFRLLDNVNKFIVAGLTFTTILVVFIAAGKPAVVAPDFVAVSPWTAVGLAFIIQLMGWMPAPLDFAAITSIWTAEKIKTDRPTYRQGLLDFNVGYITSAVLALFFLALGVFVQYGTGNEIATQGGAYVGQLIQMYAETIGNWSKPLVAIIAFLCMFGTTITCADGYGRASAECVALIQRKPVGEMSIMIWTTIMIVAGLILITFFKGQMGALLKFAMISAFVTAPVFAYLNYSLVRSEGTLTPFYHAFVLLAIAFLVGFTGLFLLTLF